MTISDRIDFGSQFIQSIDSIGANIVEGFGRYHYLDSIRFYYNARGSLFEAKHWVSRLGKRSIITNEKMEELLNELEVLGVKLNNFINSTKEQKFYNDKLIATNYVRRTNYN